MLTAIYREEALLTCSPQFQKWLAAGLSPAKHAPADSAASEDHNGQAKFPWQGLHSVVSPLLAAMVSVEL